MFIQTETTSDPSTLKFLPGRDVLGAEAASFSDAEAAERSPLAARLFEIEGVERVSLGLDFVAVTKAADADWQLLKPAIFGVIMEHFLADRPVLYATAPESEDRTELESEIAELIEARIRPGIVREGGDVKLRGFRDGVVTLELENRGFRTPAFTLKVRAENTLRYYVPEVTAVEFLRPGEDAAGEAGADLDLDDAETAAVHELLEHRVNPAVAAHGGYISLLEVKDHTAYIRLEGGCQGCGMADVTLKQGVEALIREEVPSIVAVLDTTDHAAGSNPYYEPGKAGFSPF